MNDVRARAVEREVRRSFGVEGGRTSAPFPNVRANELVAFIAVAKRRGFNDAFVVALLRRNGWSERRVFAAYTSYYAANSRCRFRAKAAKRKRPASRFSIS